MVDGIQSWLALKRVPGVGNVLYKRLIQRFQKPEAVFEADEAALLQIEGLSGRTAKEIVSFKDFDWVDREIDKIEKEKAFLLTLNDPNYPTLLAAIYDPPPILYVKGIWDTACAPHPLAVVGSRKTSPYGRAMTERLCRDLANRGVTIVSGFARGIDGIAHRVALSAGGHTLAVLGCGIDSVYPVEHKNLFRDIIEQGTLFTEFPMGALPEAHHFPQRNRIISGLSLGCVVVEASQKSGSLITAALALEQGREVFAVPGSVLSATSVGPHQLIASGAKLVQTADDIMEEILPQFKKGSSAQTIAPPELEAEEDLVYRCICFEPKHIDVLIQESDRAASQISALLLALELKGLVRQISGQYYVKI